MIPNGKLIPIGGSEARSPQDEAQTASQREADFFNNGVLAEVLTEINGPASRLVVIPAASGEPDEVVQLYQDAFGTLGCQSVKILRIDDRTQTDQPDHLQMIREADGVFFTGGDQARLVEKLVGSALLELLLARYQHEGLVIAGTSAGAAAMAHCMIAEGDSEESLRKGMVEVQAGLSLLPSVIVDTHFAQRGRLLRLIEALLQKPGLFGLGLSEDTGVVITEGNCLRAIGSGSAFVVDTYAISQNAYARINEQEPISVGNLKLHVLARGACYQLDTQQFIPPSNLFSPNS